MHKESFFLLLNFVQFDILQNLRFFSIMVTQTKNKCRSGRQKGQVKIMTLKAFQKVNSNIKTLYHVAFAETGEHIEVFEVNYLEPDNEFLLKMIRKRHEYEKMGAKIDMVTTSTIDSGILMVFLTVKLTVKGV